MVSEEVQGKGRDQKVKWLAPTIEEVQEIKRYLTKGFLVFKDEKQGAREQIVREHAE